MLKDQKYIGLSSALKNLDILLQDPVKNAFTKKTEYSYCHYYESSNASFMCFAYDIFSFSLLHKFKLWKKFNW